MRTTFGPRRRAAPVARTEGTQDGSLARVAAGRGEALYPLGKLAGVLKNCVFCACRQRLKRLSYLPHQHATLGLLNSATWCCADTCSAAGVV